MRRVLTTSLLLLALLLQGGAAHAQACRRPDLLEALPDDGARGVPTNAQLSARYDSRAEYLGESILFGALGQEPTALEGTFNEAEGLVQVVPPVPMEPDTDYVVEWPELRGFGTASLGRGRRVIFRTGEGEDTEAPRFAGVLEATWRLDRFRDDCTDRREDRFEFDLTLDAARDDGGRSSLSVVVFQTRGPELDVTAGPKPVHVEAYPEEDAIRFRLPIAEATGPVCFAAIARDLTGKASASGAKEACVETVAPPFFQGCSVTRLPFPRGAAPPLVLLAVTLVARRRFKDPDARSSR